jgi:hypothetical protein
MSIAFQGPIIASLLTFISVPARGAIKPFPGLLNELASRQERVDANG